MFDLDDLKKTRCLPNRLWTTTSCALADVLFALPRRTTISFEGLENIPDEPVVISPNHTHKFDFLPIRARMLTRHNVQMATWIKARDYLSRPMAVFFDQTGNIPLISRGYVVAADFAAVHGRRPTEDEYRPLRAWVDELADQPAADAYEPLLNRPREILGIGYDPATEAFDVAVRRIYTIFMQQTLALAERVRDAGIHQQIYPQGATSSQLTPGKTGAVQAALALGLDIVPVGISGCREVFVGNSPLARGGDIVIRFGESMSVGGLTGGDVSAFDPEWEHRYDEQLRARTGELMARINELVEPAYRWADDGRSDGKTGVKRFF
jgi:1-acyl-sn-glycerol-3-phosphate acyltransferase